MHKKIIILAGYPAAGKTTFSEELTNKLSLPCFTKDLIKVTIGEGMKTPNSRILSDTAFWTLAHVAERVMLSGRSFIVESSFKDWEGEVVRGLIEKYNYDALTFLFLGNLEILHKRFVERDLLPERHEITRVNGFYDDYARFEASMGKLGNFDIGTKKLVIDTTESGFAGFEEYVKEASDFIERKE